MGKILNYYFLFDYTQLFYHNAFDMLLLTMKLNLKCYVLYETKELLLENSIITFINILVLIISIAIVTIIIITIIFIIIIIIIIIIITITVITISIIIAIVKSAWQIS